MSGYRIKNTIQSADEFVATYKGYHVRIERIGMSVDPDVVAMDDYWEDVEPEPDGKAFWAAVQNYDAEFGTSMNGYVGNEGDTLELVLDEVLIQAGLITEEQRKFPAGASLDALNMGHTTSTTTDCPVNRAIPINRAGTKLNPKMRDCLQCGLPFFSKSTANVVCSVCKSESTAEFDGGL